MLGTEQKTAGNQKPLGSGVIGMLSQFNSLFWAHTGQHYWPSTSNMNRGPQPRQCKCIWIKCSSLTRHFSALHSFTRARRIFPSLHLRPHQHYKAALGPSHLCSATNTDRKLPTVELQATNQVLKQNTGRKEGKKIPIILRFCFLISYSTEQIRHRGTNIERNVQTWEVLKSYRGCSR